MSEYSWLFENVDPLCKGIPVIRVVKADDPSYMVPETSEYTGRSEDSPEKTPMGVEYSPMGLAEEDLADRASNKLKEGIEHLENQEVIQALTEIVQELAEKGEEYHSEHPTPGQPKEEPTEPSWAKQIESNNPHRIERCGEAPQERTMKDRIRDEMSLLLKAKKSGMSDDEVKHADRALDKAFGLGPHNNSNSIRKKF